MSDAVAGGLCNSISMCTAAKLVSMVVYGVSCAKLMQGTGYINIMA